MGLFFGGSAVWVNEKSRATTVIYRDPFNIVYRQGPHFIIYGVHTRERRFYTDLRDVVRALHRAVPA